MTGTHLVGATAVVTGGQRGLGKFVVDALLERGVTKIYATSRTPSAAEDPRVVGLTADVCDDASVAELAAIAADATIVVNNAGALGGQSLLTDDLSDIRSVMETNFYGPIRVTRAFLPILRANGGGTVVNIASVLSWLPGYGSYGTSKAALWSATNSLRIELRTEGIDVIGVYLGYTDTDMVADLDVPKNDPADVAAQIADGIESGAAEVLADDLTRSVHPPTFG